MIKKIYKYEILPDDEIRLLLPKNAEILTVQTQKNKPCLWAMVDPTAPTEERVFCLVGTGHEITPAQLGCFYSYIGTFQIHDAALVFHLFESVLVSK